MNSKVHPLTQGYLAGNALGCDEHHLRWDLLLTIFVWDELDVVSTGHWAGDALQNRGVEVLVTL